MPKTPINYENTSIYKIVCKDLNITDCYVGHTTDLVKRKSQHKRNSHNPNCKEYNKRLYQFVRNNEGFNNFDIILIEKYPCDDVNEARKRERYWIEQLKATLNMNIPTRTKAEYDQNNKEKLINYHKEYVLKNKEKIANYHKNYEKIYREQNIEKIRARKAIKIICDVCGAEHTKSHTNQHKRSQKHIKALEEKNI
jgi:hypothetical protein